MSETLSLECKQSIDTEKNASRFDNVKKTEVKALKKHFEEFKNYENSS